LTATLSPSVNIVGANEFTLEIGVSGDGLQVFEDFVGKEQEPMWFPYTDVPPLELAAPGSFRGQVRRLP
jgi:hypothetical protein